MGWTGIYNGPKTYREERDFLTNEMTFDHGDGKSSAVVGASKVNSVWYMAIKVTGDQSHAYECDVDGSYVHGLVVMTSKARGEFGYKDISESCGPTDSLAPMSIIKKLSPLVSPDRWAGGWRQACVTNAINKKMIADLTTGTKIRLGEPLRFGGVVEDTFSVTSYRSGSKNRRCFATRTGMKVRIPTECLHGMVVVG